MHIKEINMDKISNGKMFGTIDIYAEGWETRYSWGHTAEVSVNFETVARAKIRYYNRTWESYRFQSVIHSALHGYVTATLGIDPHKAVGKRDATPMKGKDAEARRLARLDAVQFAKTIYNRLCAIVDGTATEKDFEKIAAKVA